MTLSRRDVIASRKYRRTTNERPTVTLRIGAPRRVSVSEWECPFYISNAGMRGVEYGHGIDSLQALIQAVEGARVFLERSGASVSWSGAEGGETGIPRYVPAVFGKEFTEHLHAVIDREVASFVRRAELGARGAKSRKSKKPRRSSQE